MDYKTILENMAVALGRDLDEPDVQELIESQASKDPSKFVTPLDQAHVPAVYLDSVIEHDPLYSEMPANQRETGRMLVQLGLYIDVAVVMSGFNHALLEEFLAHKIEEIRRDCENGTLAGFDLEEADRVIKASMTEVVVPDDISSLVEGGDDGRS